AGHHPHGRGVGRGVRFDGVARPQLPRAGEAGDAGAGARDRGAARLPAEPCRPVARAGADGLAGTDRPGHRQPVLRAVREGRAGAGAGGELRALPRGHRRGPVDQGRAGAGHVAAGGRADPVLAADARPQAAHDRRQDAGRGGEPAEPERTVDRPRLRAGRPAGRGARARARPPPVRVPVRSGWLLVEPPAVAGVHGALRVVRHRAGGARAVRAGVQRRLSGADEALAARVTAIFAYNDMVALGVMSRLADRGVRVPDEMSVVGFDDIEVASMTSPPLTTVAIPVDTVAKASAALLLSLLAETTPQ